MNMAQAQIRTSTAPLKEATASVGVAGPNTWNVIGNVTAAVGIAGNPSRQSRSQIMGLQRASAHAGSTYLGDHAVIAAARRGMWFSDWTYIVCAQRAAPQSQIRWREGREEVFGRPFRRMPVGLDCGSYRRLLGTAKQPTWTADVSRYQAAIELIHPDLYAAWDTPNDRVASMRDLRELIAVFPQHVHDGRMWPVFSVRWTYDPGAIASFSRLPGWASRDVSTLIPINRTQRRYSASQLAEWARSAIANALVVAADPDFCCMVNTFGRVMLGGLVSGPLHRLARHIFAATLCRLFPQTHFWLLGQANFATVNGLGALELLDRVWVDGSWFLKDAMAARFGYVENGLITMLRLGSGRGPDGTPSIQPFLTLQEMMAANLRALLAAYEGLWQWPNIALPADLRDRDQLLALRRQYQQAEQPLLPMSFLDQAIQENV